MGSVYGGRAASITARRVTAVRTIDSLGEKFHHRRVMHRLAILATFVLFFMTNPAFIIGCGHAQESSFSFGEAEMLSLLETVELKPWTYEHNNETFEIEFDLEQADSVQTARHRSFSLVETAWACANRSFVNSASACMDVSQLAVAGKAVIRKAASSDALMEVEVQGAMTVYGLDLTAANLDLIHDTGYFSLISEDGQGFLFEAASW